MGQKSTYAMGWCASALSFLILYAAMAILPAHAQSQPETAAIATLAAAGTLLVLLVAAGILLIVRGLRDDLRDRKRGYRRRSRRIAERSQRTPVTPAG